VTTLAGLPGAAGGVDGGPLVARFSQPKYLAADRKGFVYVTEFSHTVRAISPSGFVSTLFVRNSIQGRIDGTRSSSAPRLNSPTGITVDRFGRVFIAEAGNSDIRVAVPIHDGATSRLTNLSVRSLAGKDDRTLIMGFVMAGNEAKPVLVRGVGPLLKTLGVNEALDDPRLKLYNATGSLLEENDNWGGGVLLRDTFAALGAYPLQAASQDAALLSTVPAGVYSAHVTATGPGTGVALAEVYEAQKSGGRLINVSARSEARVGDGILVAGFVLEGTKPKTLLIRGLGPTLSALGVTGALADPQLKLYDANGTLLAQNDDWAGSALSKTIASRVGAAALASDASKDAALIISLDPGAYSVHVSGVTNTAGVALVEIYEVQ
jgi:hypothetical protein